MKTLADGWGRALAAPGWRLAVRGEERPVDWARWLAEQGIGGGAGPLGREVVVDGTGLPDDPREACQAFGRRAEAALAREGALRTFDVQGRFVLDPSVRYLNHGSFGATPWSVLEAQRRLQEELERQPMRFMAGLAPRLREVAGRVAARVGARPEDLVLVDNVSTGVSAVLRSVPLRAGDALLTTSHVYKAVGKAIDFVAARSGATVRVAPVPWPLPSLDAVVDAVQEAWRPDVRVAVLDLVSSVSATRFPVERLIGWLQARGARVLLDAAHAPGFIPLDVEALGADWTSANLHKWWFTPKGAAFLHARAETRSTLAPTVIANGYGDGFAEAFEYQGTRDPSPWLAVPAALDFVDALGGDDAVRVHNRRLAHEGAGRVAVALGADALTPPEATAALVPLAFDGVEPTVEAVWERVDRMRDAHGVQTWMMPLDGVVTLRVCAQVYNTPEDYDALVAALRAVGLRGRRFGGVGQRPTP